MGCGAQAVAERHLVSAVWMRRLKQRRRETLEVEPRAQRGGSHAILAPHLTIWPTSVEAQPDRTLEELNDALGTSHQRATRRVIAA